ncbi:hypothetical protein [Amycolatopsis anabasis]|uniref:hypothetical protein n=1 Tax=Amycolatopsis anabasis TaxID=1840409 RepID=UPI00131E9450|nr:hypothetical protein [Amycolatopsis anabasis]
MIILLCGGLYQVANRSTPDAIYGCSACEAEAEERVRHNQITCPPRFPLDSPTELWPTNPSVPRRSSIRSVS